MYRVFIFFCSQVVYVARNPKDVMVSYYHHHKLIKFHDFNGNVEEFARYFMQDKCSSYRVFIILSLSLEFYCIFSCLTVKCSIRRSSHTSWVHGIWNAVIPITSCFSFTKIWRRRGPILLFLSRLFLAIEKSVDWVITRVSHLLGHAEFARKHRKSGSLSGQIPERRSTRETDSALDIWKSVTKCSRQQGRRKTERQFPREWKIYAERWSSAALSVQSRQLVV